MRRGSNWWGVVLDAPDPLALAQFYADLLDWRITAQGPEGAAVAPTAEAECYIACQAAPSYVRPVWPPTEGQQQMMLHLDFEVTDLAASVAEAVELGATVAEFQPQDDVRVLLDPVGHPFCLYLDPSGSAE